MRAKGRVHFSACRIIAGGAVFFFAVAFAALGGTGILKVTLVSGSAEYESDRTLAAFKDYMERNFEARCMLVKAIGVDSLPGLKVLEECDVALFFTRRLTIGGEELKRVQKYCESGRPIVAVRTASHGFQNWLEFDRLILGGHYHNHFANGPTIKMAIAKGGKDHPILKGIELTQSRASLYRTAPLAEDATLLLTGETLESGGAQPVAWTRTRNGQRIFYTSLGAQSDFENPMYLRMLANALFWAAGRDLQRKTPATLVPSPTRRR